jgi:hypothetical protein
MKTPSSERVRFGAFELDLSTGELRFVEASDSAEVLKFDSLEMKIQRLRLASIEGDRDTLNRIFNGETDGSGRIQVFREQFEAQQGHLDSADRVRPQASKVSS